MNTIFFGHACLKVVGQSGHACIMDPWFSKTGAFFRSWFQFPENAPLLDEAMAGVTDICVSHNHADHWDPPVLRKALADDPERRVHIARFATPWFGERARRDLGELGDRLVEHEPFTPFFVKGGGLVYFVPEESPGQVDSGIVYQSGGRCLVNLNDARLSTSQLTRIKELGGEIAVLTLQASGASEYPINYLFDDADMRARKREKRRLKFDAAESIHDLLEPERVLFFAGPPVFLDRALDHLNDLGDDSVFPDQLAILRHFEARRPDVAAKSWFLLPGDELDDSRLWSKTDLRSERLSPFTDKVAYIEAYRERRSDHLDFDAGEPPPSDRLLAHFEKMATLSPWMSERIGGAITFRVEGRTQRKTFTVDFGARRAVEGDAGDPLYVITAPASSVAAVLRDEATWDDVMLSVRMTFDERTPRFVPHFKTLLKYMDARMFAALEKYEDELQAANEEVAMIEIEHGGTTYRLQRFCPHSGVDLLRHGQIGDDGTITCMAHRFCWDLSTGRCLNATGFALKVDRAT